MPVAQTRGHAGKALLIASVAVVLLLLVGWGVATLASRGEVDIRLGDERFEAGSVEKMAKSIADGDGLPLLYADLVGGRRPLYVQHTGSDPDRGWVAFGAFVPEDPACAVEIDREAKVLRDACDPTSTYPLDGTGLRAYPVSVEDGDLYVDINERSTTTTTAADG